MVAPVKQFYNRQNAELPATAVESRYINRDLSLLEFFKSVLHEALDDSTPLLERLKFLSIFSSNIDEFFMIRVSALKEKIGRRVEVSQDGYSRPDLLAEIRKRVIELSRKQIECLNREILPALAEQGIVLESYSELSSSEQNYLSKYFDRSIAPVLTPLAVDPTHPFPYISGGSLNIGLMIKPSFSKRVARAFVKIGEEFFARIKVPSSLSRFVPLDENSTRFVLIEDIIIANIAKITEGSEPEHCHQFRITRDADIDLREAEARDLLETMEENLKERRFGDVVRLEVSDGMPSSMVSYLTQSLNIVDEDVYVSYPPFNIADFWSLVGLNRPDLKEPPIMTDVPPVLRAAESTFDVIKAGDVLLHHPYTPYSIVTDMIREAANDPDVLAIKMCLYRIGSDSPIAPLLVEASEKGKQVTVLIEIKARFDEANNIEWGRRLERAGVHVVYGLLGLKTHAKTTLIVRREGDGLKRYVHLATGNYNPATSTVYTDLGILTANDDIAADVSDLFNYLSVYNEPKNIRTLLMAPLNLRERMKQLIERETKNAVNGRPARIVAKINRVADAEIVDLLYAASQAGVQIDLIVRGICTLRPGVPGLSENIRVRSIVGRLLEHSRVYYFENDGNGEVYLGSSDWMPRNLDRRVEVLTPVNDPKIRRFLVDEYIAAYLNDNAKARELSFQKRGNTLEFAPRQ